MSLAMVVDDLVAHLVASGVAASDRLPSELAGVPAVTLSVEQVDRPNVGVGGFPSGPQQGALVVDHSIDLADPTLGSGSEAIALLDADRLVLVVPNGPLVTASGAEGPPFGPADVTVASPGGPWTLTDDAPVGREFRVDPDAGTLEFGEALENSGQLTVGTHVGVWDMSIIGFRGTANVDVTTNAADAAALARSIADALSTPPAGFDSLIPNAWGAARPTVVEETTVLTRRLTYLFVYERIVPVVPTSGGVIRLVDVTSDTDGGVEPFTVPIPA